MDGRYTILFAPLIIFLIIKFIQLEIEVHNLDNHYTTEEEYNGVNYSCTTGLGVLWWCNDGMCKVGGNSYENTTRRYRYNTWGKSAINNVVLVLASVLLLVIFICWYHNSNNKFLETLDSKFSIEP